MNLYMRFATWEALSKLYTSYDVRTKQKVSEWKCLGKQEPSNGLARSFRFSQNSKSNFVNGLVNTISLFQSSWFNGPVNTIYHWRLVTCMAANFENRPRSVQYFHRFRATIERGGEVLFGVCNRCTIDLKVLIGTSVFKIPVCVALSLRFSSPEINWSLVQTSQSIKMIRNKMSSSTSSRTYQRPLHQQFHLKTCKSPNPSSIGSPAHKIPVLFMIFWSVN